MEFNFAEKVNVLGTDYTIEVKAVKDDKTMARRHLSGYCAILSKRIVLRDITTRIESEFMTEDEGLSEMKDCLRHEITHAFLSESGLRHNTTKLGIDKAWALNEEMVDWIAIQGPKIYKAWQEAGAI